MNWRAGLAEFKNALDDSKLKRQPLNAEYFLLESFCSRRLGKKNSIKNFILKNYHQVERFIANNTNVKKWHEADRIEIIKVLYGVQFTKLPENFIIFAMPKSGSTSLHRMLASCIQGNSIEVGNINSENDFLLDPFIFLNCLGDPRAVVKSHAICTQRVLAILNLTNLRPIILSRNIEDCLNSMLTHFSSSQEAEKYGFHHLNSSEKSDLIFLKYSYGYHQFLKSWRIAAFKGPVKYLNYESLFYNIYLELSNTFLEFDCQVSSESIKNAISEMEMVKKLSPEKIRYNQENKKNSEKFIMNRYAFFEDLFEKLK